MEWLTVTMQLYRTHTSCNNHKDYKHSQPPPCGWPSAVRKLIRIRIAMPTQPYHTRRLTLLDSTFWEVLPVNYDKIKQCRSKIATLHDEAKSDLLPSDLLPSDRAGAVNSLKAELEMLEKDIDEYRSNCQRYRYH